MYPPTAIAALVPMFRAPDDVPRMTLTSPSVSTPSIATPTQSDTPEAGTVAPWLIPPIVHRRNRHARNAPGACALHGKNHPPAVGLCAARAGTSGDQHQQERPPGLREQSTVLEPVIEELSQSGSFVLIHHGSRVPPPGRGEISPP